MSTPIDPPLSRRAARQSEVTAQDAPPQSFAQPLTRRARANAPAPGPSSTPGDVSFRTEVRPRVPHYDAPPAGHAVIAPDGYPIASPASQASTGAPTFGVPPLVEPPVAPSAAPSGEQMRRRDYRPPSEQQPPPAGPTMPPGGGVIGVDAPLDYHTQLTAGVPGPIGHSPMASGAMPTGTVSSGTVSDGTVSSGTVSSGTVASAPGEQTLSRRELRELRDRVGLPVGEAPHAPAATYAPPPAPAQSYAPPLAPANTYAPPQGPAPTFAPAEAPAPTYQPPQSPAFAYEQPMAPAPTAPAAVPDASTSVSPSPSTGSHWSVGIHDDDDPFENTFSREVGSSVSLTNTNALVLPEMPIGGISGPVAGTGEIIITGMIDLPRVVSSTGTVPTVHESPDIDDIFDPGDLTAGPADAAPVSALKAVSSHTAARSIITTGKRSSGNAVTTVLVASTVVMAVVAIGLFVLAAVNGLF